MSDQTHGRWRERRGQVIAAGEGSIQARAMALGLLLISLPGLTDAWAQVPVDAEVAYSARFVCGEVWETAQEGLARGIYDTEITIANPGSKPVRFEKRISRALPFQRSGDLGEPVIDTLAPGRALVVECHELRTLLPLSMTAQPRGGFLTIRSEAPLQVAAVLTARGPEGDASALDRFRVAERALTCAPGFGGPDCVFACLDGPRCDLRIFYNSDGSPRHITGLGTPLFTLAEGDDGGDVLERFRDLVLAHQDLLGLEGLGAGDLDHLTWDGQPPLAYGPLMTYRVRQSYRGLPVYGSEAQLTLSASPGNGVIGFTGTVLDERIDYAGLDAPISAAVAAASVRDWYVAAVDPDVDPSRIHVETPVLAAMPQKRVMVYVGEVHVGRVHIATLVINADSALAPDQPLLSVDFNALPDLENEQPITVRAQALDVEAPLETNLIGDQEPTDDFSQSVEAAPILGSLYEPDVCLGDPGAPGCSELRLGNTEIVVLDARNTSLDDPAEIRVPTDGGSGAFLADPFTPRYSQQAHFHHLLNGFRQFGPLKIGTWDSINDGLMGGPVSDFPPGSYVPRLIVFERAQDACGTPADGCAGSRLLVGNGPGELPGDLFDLPPHVPFPGAPFEGEREGYGLIIHQEQLPFNRNLAFHELGHTIDSYTAARTMSSSGGASGCMVNGTCVQACMMDTGDEAPALAETVAQLASLWLWTRVNNQVGYDSCSVLNGVSNGGVVFPLSGVCEENGFAVQRLSFQNERPDDGGIDGAGNPTGKCDHFDGYRQNAIFQAWWAFLHGQDCLGQSPFPCDSFDVPGTEGTEIAGARAFLYALARGNGQPYVELFEHMSDYLYCAYDEATGDRFRRIFARHDVLEEEAPPPDCLCGNGTIDPGEACDTADLGGATCDGLGQGFTGGVLACTDQCTFDTSACTTCGDGVREMGEACDGADLGGETCASQGFDGGPLACTGACLFDTGACHQCGNGVREGSEVCDGADLAGETCESQGFGEGDLQCRLECDAFLTSDCQDDCVGEPSCPCHEGGASELPNNGLLGDGRFCNDDVTLGGNVRCVQDGPNFVCDECTFNEGWGCPCGVDEDSCLSTDQDPPEVGDLFCWGHTQDEVSFTGNCWDAPPDWFCDAHCERNDLECVDPDTILCGSP